MNPSVTAQLAQLQSQMNALRLQMRGSPGVSTAGGGSLSIRTLQLGFAAELTSTYDATDGYSWKRTKLEPPAFVNPTVQLTGNQAFEIGGNEDLESGTPVWMEPSPDAVGYVFTLSANASPDGSIGDCAKSWLRLPDCATLATQEQAGACGCVPTQTAAMVKSSSDTLTSDTLLYGCPPGVVTTDCPNGAPSKFNLVVAGFTGGSTGYNGNWTLTYIGIVSGTMTWKQTKGSVSWTLKGLSGGPWQLFGDDGVSAPTYDSGAVAAGCCSSETMAMDDSGGSDTPPANLTITPATACGKGPAYTPVLSRTVSDCGICLKLKWVPVAGSGARSIEFQVVECGTDSNGQSYIDFATDDPLLCTDPATGCGVNSFVCRVTCGECPCATCVSGIPWAGAGYYTVDGACCVYYDSDPGGSVKLCEGPLATSDDCHSVAISCCPGVRIPRKLCLTFSSDTYGPWGSLDGIVVVLENYYGNPSPPAWADPYGSGSYWVGQISSIAPGACGGPPIRVVATPCDGGTKWQISIVDPTPGATTNFASGYTSDPTCAAPFSAVLNWSAVSYAPCYTGSSGKTVTASVAVNADCANNPPPATYICVDGSCVEVYDGSGSSYADCLAVCSGGGGTDCGSCALTGTATLVCGLGTFTALWVGSGPWSVIFTDGSFTGSIGVDCTGIPGEAPVLRRYDGGGVQLCAMAATGVTCGPPSVFTFTGTCAGGGLTTVTT